MNSSKFKLLYFGSDSFSVRILKHVLDKKLCPIQIVTRRNSLLDQFSTKRQIRIHRWPLDENNSIAANIGLVASFGQLIDEKTIRRFKYGLFNVHPSLLPQYRGSTPVQAAIKDGREETGCTIMRIPPIAKFDIGDITLQERLPIKYRESALELRDRLADIGATMAERLLTDYNRCIESSRPQGIEGRSYAKKITPEQGLVKFKCESSEIIDRKVRAYTGFIDLYTYCLDGLKVRLEGSHDPRELEHYDLDSLVVKFHRLKHVIDDIGQPYIEPGTIYLHKTRHLLCIKCADDKWIAFDSITPESKARMSGLDFYNGYLSKVNINSSITDI